MADLRAYMIKVSGDVQGVFYRHYTLKKAKRLGITGWVVNENDGSVTIFAQGEIEKLKELVNWAHEGSPMATVEHVDVEVAGYDDSIKKFEVK